MKKMYKSADVKEKFAILLSKLHQAKLLTEYINDVVVKSSFFDCFENNDFEDFMTMSYETIAKEVFNKETVFDYSLDYINEFYWAGLVYMDLVFNYSVPLKRAMLVYPLKEMVDLYYPYHEAHFSKACKYYLDIEKERSVLDILVKEKGIQLTKLAFITQINEKSLRLFLTSNAALFATSMSSLIKLASFFEVDISIFKSKSSCVCYSETFLKEERFRDIFVDQLLSYLGIKRKENISYSYFDLENKDIREILTTNDLIVLLFEPYGVIKFKSHQISQKYINNTEFLFLYSNAIDIYRKETNRHLI